MKLRACVLASVLGCSLAGPAFAQSTSDDAASRALFDEGRKLMDAGKFAEACPKFEEGQRLSPGIGMKYNLGECYERLGKLASAWAAFLDVASMAKAAGQPEREAVAKRRARALEGDLLKLKIDVPAASRLEGLEIRRDGGIVGPGQWGTPIPADGGEHTVTATAPGRVKFEKKVGVAGAAGSVSTLEIPLLKIDPRSTEKPTSLVAQPQPRGGTQRTIGYIAGGAGVVAAAIGSVFGVIAMNKYSQSSSYCFPGNQCLADGVTLRHDAITSGNISTISFIAGGVLVAAGVVLLVTAPTGTEVTKSAKWLGPAAPGGMTF
jgi:hypothetical protein